MCKLDIFKLRYFIVSQDEESSVVNWIMSHIILPRSYSTTGQMAAIFGCNSVLNLNPAMYFNELTGKFIVIVTR